MGNRRGFTGIEVVLFTGILAVPLAIATWTYKARFDGLALSVAESPLPDVQLAERVSPPSPYRQPYTFTTDWFTSNIPVWRAALKPFIGRPNVRYLEIGLWEGRSAMWMLENVLTHPTSRLVGIDIFDGEPKDRYFSNSKLSGAADRAETIIEPSQLALRRLPLESFDIIYVDGSHAEDDVLEDAVLSYRLLKSSGVMIFDDYRFVQALAPDAEDAGGRATDFVKASADRFVMSFSQDLETIHNGYQLVVRKR